MDNIDRLQIDIERWSEARSHINEYRKEGIPHLRNNTLTHMLTLVTYVQTEIPPGARADINKALSEVM